MYPARTLILIEQIPLMISEKVDIAMNDFHPNVFFRNQTTRALFNEKHNDSP